MGASGSGKTSSLRKWIDAGLEVRAIFTEPSFEVIGDISCEQGLHYHYIPPTTQSWSSLEDTLKKINTFDFKGLSDLKDISKKDFDQMMSVIRSCNKFVCSRCGKDFGSVDTWGTNVLFVVDSLSGINDMAMKLVVGTKPAKSMSDWGVAMDVIKNFIVRLSTIHAHFLLIAHIEKEVDETSGGVHTTLSTLGRKLAPQLILNFSDVILAKRDGDKFTWSTTAANTDLKARNLPFSNSLPPDPAPILATWKSRGGIVES